MRIVKTNVTDADPADMKRAFDAALGRVLTVKEVFSWETGDPACPYHVNYEFYVAHLLGAPNSWSFLETIYMDEGEIEPVRRRGLNTLQTRGATSAT